MSVNQGHTHKFQTDGTYIGRVFTSLLGGAWEGLSHNDTGLLALNDGGATDRLRHLVPVEDLYPGFWGFMGSTCSIYDTGLSTYTSWTMGFTAVKTDNAAAHLGVGGYGISSGGGSEDSAAAKIIFRVNTSINWGCWNSTDSWLMGSGSTSNTPYRLAYTHNGTTARKLYVNGTETVDNTVAQRPTAGDTFFCGASRATGAEPFRGAINFAYLRNGVLTAEWLAAEADNCITPASFYTITEN